MARAGMSPAKLRYIVGHSDISTTYNVYTHLGLEDIQDEMLAIEQKPQVDIGSKNLSRTTFLLLLLLLLTDFWP